MSSQDVTAVLVNYNSGQRLGPLLDVLEPQVASVVIVDNASSDGSLAAAEGRSRVKIIRNTSNRGFAAAVNQGSREARGEWLLLVNPDTHLGSSDVETLLGSVPPDVVAVAPLQVDERGRPLSETGGYKPSLPRYLVWAVLPTRFHGRWGPWLAPPFPDRDIDLDWVSGALLALRREEFLRLGGFDERFFLYHEDVDFGRRARENGLRVLCRPSVRLHHEVAHGEPHRRVLSGLRSTESLALQFSGWRRRVLGLVLGAGYGVRAAIGSGTTRAVARAALPHCLTLISGRVPAKAGHGT